MIRNSNNIITQALPTVRFAGVLSAHECTWPEATAVLTKTKTTTDFVKKEAIASLYYYPRFKQGATLVPRNLAFVTSAQPDLTPNQIAFTPIMQSDPDVNDESKEPWKGLRLEAHIDDDFLFAT